MNSHKLYSVLLELVEPVIPRGAGEVDPGVRGPHTHGAPLLMPNPTSITGILLTIYHSSVKGGLVSRARDVSEWYKDFEANLGLGDEGNSVRGPFIYIDLGDRKVLLTATLNGWSVVDELINKLYKLKNGGYLNKPEKFGEVMRYLNELIDVKYLDALEDRVTIALEENVKRIKPHYFTIFKFIDYAKVARSVVRGQYPTVFIGVELWDKNGKISEVVKIIKEPIPVRTFGRGRISVLRILNEAPLRSVLERVSKGKFSEVIGNAEIILYNISPILLDVETVSEDMYHEAIMVIPAFKQIHDYVRKELEDLCKCDKSSRDCVRELRIYGKVSIIGSGYSLRFRKRKPLYNGLLPGSLIYAKVRKCSATLEEVYSKGMGLLRHLGFGTIVPLIL